MQPGRTAWLSIGFEELLNRLHKQPEVFDVIIVGSGYGGAVAAAELAGCTKEDGEQVSICVLERGREYLPGMFASRLVDLAGHVRFTAQSGRARGRREGLFDIRIGDDVNAILANGLGGGSLINAGVMAVPDQSVFKNWPGRVREELCGEDGFYRKAKALLGVNETAGKWAGTKCRPAKLSAFEQLGAGAVREAPLTISLHPGRNDDGVALQACKMCGDCATGCNHGAKNSLDSNLLVKAWRTRRNGPRPLTDIVTGATVLRIERQAGAWLVHTVHTDEALRNAQSAPAQLAARKVILAAGTFGSTEILLRSKKAGLAVSGPLGSNFSANGDAIAVVYGQAMTVNAVADESVDADRRQVGPTITGMLKRADLVVQEIAIPGPLRRLFEETVTTVHAVHALERPDFGFHFAGAPRQDPCAVDASAIGRSSAFVMMGDDGADGRLDLVDGAADGDGAIRVHWSELKGHPLFETQIRFLRERVERSGRKGIVLPNPVWQLMPDKMQFLFDAKRGPPLTVHPLGGCPMGANAKDGVVNEFGQVFDGAGAPWPDLVVLDGSIVRGALAINPALTIAALALRAVRHLRDKVWRLRLPRPGKPAPLERPPFRTVGVERASATALQLVERMSGYAMLRSQGSEPMPVRIELELTFEKKPIAELVLPTNGRGVAMARRLKVETGTLRLFEKSAWDNWRDAGDSEKALEDIVELGAKVEGTLTLLHRERSWVLSRIWRAWRAWWRNRGLRDTCQWLEERRSPEATWWRTLRLGLERLLRSLALASRAGEIRLFDYELFLKSDATAHARGTQLRLKSFPARARIRGRKRLTYKRRANPWRQLMEMELCEFPDLATDSPILQLDAKFLAGKGVPLVKIVGQNDQVTALADLTSFVAYFLRLLLNIHVWSFRRPDDPNPSAPQRLPSRDGIPGRLPKPQTFDVERACLWRYRVPAPRGLPVLMIHGYSASGTTFAHHAVKPCMAEYFCKLGREVWVVDLRTSSGMPTASQNWTFEDAALQDLPAAIFRIYEVLCEEAKRDVGQRCIDVFAHCMGAAMFSMAILAQPGNGRLGKQRAALPELVHRAVLCQIAPVVVMSPANIFRGYAMSYLRHFLPFDNYRFRVGPDPGLSDQLIDRFLATLPYPEEEFDLENPPPGRSASFVATRHRMDALYGRDFSLANKAGEPLIADEVLEHIDDLFGPLSIETVSQAIHFARSEVITTRAGRNEYVLPRNFERWKFPTASIHGRENGLSDVATLERFRKRFAEDAKIPIVTKAFDDFGHQDCLIGKRAPEVFQWVYEFLEGQRDAAA